VAILTKTIKLSEFNTMTDAQKESRVNELFRMVLKPTESEVKNYENNIRTEIHYWETQYKMSSEQMRSQFLRRELAETDDIRSWLNILEIKDGFEKKYRSSQSY
jgi:hypothetical protein